MQMSPISALLGLDLRLFGTPHLVPPSNFPVDQFVSPISSVAALAYYAIHDDKHATISKSTGTQRALDQLTIAAGCIPCLLVLGI